MTDPSLDDLDLVNAVFEHRLRQPELEGVLSTLSQGASAALLDKVGDVLRQSSTLHEVGEKMSESLSLDVLLPRLMEIITSTLGAERSTLFLHDEEANELYSRVVQGSEVDEIRLAAGEGIAGSVLSSGVGVYSSDPYKDPRFQVDVDRRSGFRTRNLLCAPVRYDGKTVGVIEVLNKHHGEFGGEDLRLLDLLTAQAAKGLAYARVYERVERARREEAKLRELGANAASELTLNTLLARAVAVATEMLDADRSTLFLYDRNTDELWSRVAEGVHTREIRVPATAGIAGASFSAGEVINIANAYEDARFHRRVDKETGYVTRSVLSMPVINRQGRKLGVIQVLNKREGRFDAVDERRLYAYCAQVAVALGNATLFEEATSERDGADSMLQSARNAMITLSAQGRMIKVNDAALHMFGWRVEFELGRDLDTLFAHPANRWVKDSVDKVRRFSRIEVVTGAELVLAGGAAATMNLTVLPLLHAENGASGYLLVFEDITIERRLKTTMVHSMGQGVADRFLARGEDVLEGRVQVATVLYSDIRDLTSIAGRLGAAETISMLNEYCTHMLEVIFNHRGTLDKYIGDALMALFGAPFPGYDDADNALRVANEMIRILRRFNSERHRSGRTGLDIGVGISTGEVVTRGIGPSKHANYGDIGDTVNVAARLEAATKLYGVKVLFSESTAESLRSDTIYREIDLVRFEGAPDPIVIYESLDHLDGDFPGMDATRRAYEIGIKRYFNSDWRGAALAFEEALGHHSGDGPSMLYLKRCRRFLQSPPPPGWDGVWTLGAV